LRPASGEAEEIQAKMVVNVTGPWAKSFLTEVARINVPFGLRLVQGSHIIVPRLYEGTHAYILQNDDRRVVFAYPYETRYTLIGTTDVELRGAPEHCAASAQEMSYLCRAVNRYFRGIVTEQDVVHSYAGIRPLFDDGAGNPSQITRDYVLRMIGDPQSAAILSVFGGKITTYRRLAEEVVDALRPWFPQMSGRWTADTPLDGGELGAGGWTGAAGGRRISVAVGNDTGRTGASPWQESQRGTGWSGIDCRFGALPGRGIVCARDRLVHGS
jgi:glycerol-3-phosphate dehydrogenase